MQSKVQINVRMWALVSRVETMVVCLMEVTLASVGGGDDFLSPHVCHLKVVFNVIKL